jgi:hypothetical protein
MLKCIFAKYLADNAALWVDVHARIHPKWDMLPNGTFISGQMAHTGQFFVPDDINVRVDKVCSRANDSQLARGLYDICLRTALAIRHQPYQGFAEPRPNTKLGRLAQHLRGLPDRRLPIDVRHPVLGRSVGAGFNRSHHRCR